MYNPDNEAHHNVPTSTNKSFAQKSPLIEHGKRVHINTSNIDNSLCQKDNEIKEYASLHTEIDIKEEDIYDQEKTKEYNSIKLKTESESNEESINVTLPEDTDVKEECFDKENPTYNNQEYLSLHTEIDIKDEEIC